MLKAHDPGAEDSQWLFTVVRPILGPGVACESLMSFGSLVCFRVEWGYGLFGTNLTTEIVRERRSEEIAAMAREWAQGMATALSRGDSLAVEYERRVAKYTVNAWTGVEPSGETIRFPRPQI